jgi:hypothetical protein
MVKVGYWKAQFDMEGLFRRLCATIQVELANLFRSKYSKNITTSYLDVKN